MVGTTEPVAGVDFCRLGLNMLERLGPEQLTNALDISSEELSRMLLGDLEFPEEVKQGLLRMDGVLSSGRQAVRLSRDVPDEIDDASVPSPTKEDLDVLPEPVVGTSGGYGGAEVVMDRLKADLYAARLMATRNLMDLRLRDDEILTNQLVVLEIELTIILHFGDSVPTPGMNWTDVQCHEEAEKRLRRLRWVNSALNKYDRGIRGMFRRFVGGKRRSPREMLNDMMVEADTLHRLGSGEVVESREEVLRKVLEPAGLDADRVVSLLQAGGESVP